MNPIVDFIVLTVFVSVLIIVLTGYHRDKHKDDDK